MRLGRVECPPDSEDDWRDDEGGEEVDEDEGQRGEPEEEEARLLTAGRVERRC